MDGAERVNGEAEARQIIKHKMWSWLSFGDSQRQAAVPGDFREKRQTFPSGDTPAHFTLLFPLSFSARQNSQQGLGDVCPRRQGQAHQL